MKNGFKTFATALLACTAVLLLTAASSALAIDFDTCQQQCKDLHYQDVSDLARQKVSAEGRSRVLSKLEVLNRCVEDCRQGISPLSQQPAASASSVSEPSPQPEPRAHKRSKRK